jgi:hypothetical protein
VRSAAVFLLVCFQTSACVPDDPPPGSKAAQAIPSRDVPPRPISPLPVPRPMTRAFPAPSAMPRPTSSSQPLASGAATTTAAGPEHDVLLVAPFIDRFDRAEVGPDWTSTGGSWRLEGGRLCVEHARNHPLWLRRRLPTNARIEFDAMSGSDDGDLKVELWGDGRSAADSISYNDATSYLTIFGGWKNSFHVLARIDEHAPNRPEVRLEENSDDLRARKVEKGRSYHFKVTRDDGHTVRWLVDDLEILTYPDSKPLMGPGHDHFGFNDWDVRACFDNLTITPLPGGAAPPKQELR